MCWDPPIDFMLSLVLTAHVCSFRCCSGLMICFFHTLTSLHHVSKARSLHLCVPFVGSWTICLTAWITDARHTVLKVLLLIGSTGNEMAPITMVVWHPSGYKYLIRSSPRTISHSFPWFALGFPLSCPLFTINGGPKRH
jgi:hypothetical protein